MAVRGMDPLIRFDHVSYWYEQADGTGIPAINDLSLTINEGEFVAVVGANGSGKSTFARLMNSLLIPGSGSVLVRGLDTRIPANRARIHAAIGMVFQFPEDQIISTTVEEDVAFGPENLGLPAEDIRLRVEDALQEVGLWELRRRPPHLLSAGQTQRLALAGVLAMRPRCVIFDEASTMLDPSGRRALVDSMHRLNREGTTILFITHFMEEAAFARRIIVFERGRVALDGPAEQVFSDPQRLARLRLDLPPAALAADGLRGVFPNLPTSLYTLQDLLHALPDYPGSASAPPNSTGALAYPEETSTQALIEVSDLGHVYLRGTPLAQRALDGVSLEVPEGQVHGLLGKTGSGKSTFMQHLNCLLRPQEGSVRVGDFLMNDLTLDRRLVIRKVGLVFQNPESQFFEHFVGDEIAYGPRQLKVEEPLAERVRWAMDQVGLDFSEFKDRPLFALSGGERRKVALASTLALKPSILLLDEPTAGLDPHTHRDLLDKLAEMRSAGITIVLSSHQMEDMAALAAGLTVFAQGKNVLSGPTAAVFAQGERLRSFGMEPPVTTALAEDLRAKGWPVPADVLRMDDLAGSIARALQKVTP